MVVEERTRVFVCVDASSVRLGEARNLERVLIVMSLRKAQWTLGAAATFTGLVIWGVHFQQQQEAEVRAVFRAHLQPR